MPFHLAGLITPSAVIPRLRVADKKLLLEELSRRAAEITGESGRSILTLLVERERLGTSGVGAGVAIPFAKVPGLKGLYGLFARLDRPIDFDAIDDQPVDLVFLLLGPSGAGGEYLKALAGISRLLRDRRVCRKLRESGKAEALYAVLIEETASSNAA